MPSTTKEEFMTPAVARPLVLWCSLFVCGNALSASKESVDALFAAWSKASTPGCALGAMQDGKIVYSRGYGLADVEHSVPITPTTVFHVASVSKQFTAFAIYLLAQDGRLSIDDDVRKYIPELHDFAKTITVRQLLHHTSGLRDQWSLLALAGWRPDDVVTEQDVLNLVWRQRGLNFAPGEEWLYTNTGYTLLGVIVERVSGKSLREFTDERVFRPLRMDNTHFHDEYGVLVTGRAYSYERQQDGAYRYVALSYSTVGPSSLFTTVEDLARWDENFYTAKIGGKDMLGWMQTRGRLNNGAEVDYASGLLVGEYRGLKTIEHNGADAGYRAELLRFPEAHFSVVVLCNAAEADPSDLAHEVADVYLSSRLTPGAAKLSPPTQVALDPKLLDAYVGEYQLAPGLIISVTRDGNQLTTQTRGQPKAPIFPSGSLNFFWKTVDAQLTFDRPISDGKAPGVTLHAGSVVRYARRVEGAHPTAEQLRAYAGKYYSEELDTLYTVSARDGNLFVRYPRGEVEMTPTVADAFATPFPLGTFEYHCSDLGHCDSFTVSTDRVRRLRFDRVELNVPTGEH
jgi:CubicO group peptidase (beta-lactamase class C family)